jgi:MGT family glycosyltransferase
MTGDLTLGNDYLFAILDGGGHAPPMLSVVRALTARGHRVRVLAQETLWDQVHAVGAEWVPWCRAPLAQVKGSPHDTGRRSPAEELAHIRDGLMCGPAAAFAADTRAELRRRPADVVVADHMLPGVLIGAEAEGARTAAMAMTFLGIPQWGVPATGLGLTPSRRPLARAQAGLLRMVAERNWGKGLPAINEARRLNGLAEIDDAVELVAGADRVLVLASASLEFPEFRPPDHVRLVGPRLDDPGWAGSWAPPPGDEPLVLVSLSSTWMDQLELLQRIATALGRLPVRGVITTGPAIDPATLEAPENVDVVGAAPHSEVLQHAAVTLTHGGHGTVAKSLAAGVPLVCMPLGRDQPDVAARVVRAGAGVRVKAEAEPGVIAEAITRVLSGPSYTGAARKLATAFAEERREDGAVAELEALAAEAQSGLAEKYSSAVRVFVC